MVWRKADNWTAFTDGYRTWINGPDGLKSRLNTERFPWEAPAAAASGPIVPLEFSGNGSQSVLFSMPSDGVAVAKFDYRGSDHFGVQAINQLGGVTQLADRIGTWSGTTAVGLPAGGYQLVVTAFGPWTATIWTAAHWPTGGSIATTLSGGGTNVLPITLSAGSARFTMRYQGDGNFNVRLLQDDGGLAATLANQIVGAWIGVFPVQVRTAGNYLLVVDSSGPWNITVEQS